MADDLPSANACRALLNPTDPASGTVDGMPFAAWWRQASPNDRRGWVDYAAGLGVVPEGYFDPSLSLAPAMTLAPGAFCYRVLALEAEATGSGGGGASEAPAGAVRGDDDGREWGPRDRDLVARLLDWLRGLLSRAAELARNVLRTVTDTIRTILDTVTGAAGGAALWLGLGLALLTALYLATRDGKGRARRAR